MRRAFTLIELLVVISIITLLIAILLPALSKAREVAIITQCATQTRGLGQAILSQAIDNKGNFRDIGNENGEWDNPAVPGSTASMLYPYWMNVEARRDLNEGYGIPRDYFYCPANPDWNTDGFWIGNGSHFTVPYTVTAYQFFVGRPSYSEANGSALSGFQEVPAGARPFHKNLEDTAYYDVMVADVTRYFSNSFHRAPFRASNHIYEDQAGVTTMPSGTGGTNVTYIDGHTEWVQQNEMGQRESPYIGLPQFEWGNVKYWF
jgi:prepilin-type N-terminal cleavage/methylation domain-containing protein